ncbi:hypothetical protein [Blautia producta]|mgnify:CR=1 FL=1|uniref:Restriction endonuclease n=2 Tax=Blautia producta TaxID=33035 RepID=A0A7G5N1E6_9FIRM|nr:hypothetical protein [Blautia producta]QIB56539.1 hypothetical protein GXM18_17740 [Blautia producta ATCC 27340 = DSM 2950]QMW80689.1 hypothetical protein E5259_25645 [Blautia producta]
MSYTHGRRWTEEIISESILNIVSSCGMNTFPTHSEMEEFYGNKALCVKISRTGGTRYWAERLHLPIKKCESEFGNDYELKAMDDIWKETGMHSRQTKPRYPYDLVVNNWIKVDVKVSKQIYTNCHTWQNSFNLEKKDPTCDIFILYCLDKNGTFIKKLIIPSCVLTGQTQVGVGNNSKWNKYEENWNTFWKYYEFYKGLKEART